MQLIFNGSGKIYAEKADPHRKSEKQKRRKPRKRLAAFFSGTPERTLTSDLPLRRRPLYTAELLGRMSLS